MTLISVRQPPESIVWLVLVTCLPCFAVKANGQLSLSSLLGGASNPPLISASGRGDLAAVKKVLEAGADVNMPMVGRHYMRLPNDQK